MVHLYRLMLVSDEALDLPALESMYRSEEMTTWRGEDGKDAPQDWQPQRKVTLDTFRELMTELQHQVQSMASLPSQEVVGVLLLDVTAMQAAMLPVPKHCLKKVRVLFGLVRLVVMPCVIVWAFFDVKCNACTHVDYVALR
jgi:hypothetical protein